MNREYYDALQKMEQQHVREEYRLGWATAYVGSPQIEQQRRTEPYVAGYQAGCERTLETMTAWIVSENE